MLKEFINGFLILCLYFVVLALTILTVKSVFRLQREYIRKMMHTICFLSIFVLTGVFRTWYLAAGAAALFAAIVYPVLALCERSSKYSTFFNQRCNGEVKNSLLLVFLMMAAMISVFWGILGDGWKYIIVVAILAWGFGDAAAALVGKRFGTHQIQSGIVGGTKTWEGTIAMYIVAVAAIFISLSFYIEMPWYKCMAVALTVGMVSAFSELVSRNGNDTVSVPVSTAVLLFSAMYIYIH